MILTCSSNIPYFATMNNFLITLSIFFLSIGLACADEVDLKQVKCLVCRSSIEEVEGVLAKIKPTQDMEIGNFRLDADGNVIKKKIPLSRSEIHISDVLDDICNRMDDYVRAKYKSNGKLTIMKLMTESGQMNPDMSIVDIIQDGDLNKSLKHYCEELVEMSEDDIVKYFRDGETDVINKVCTESSKFCSDELPADQTPHDYEAPIDDLDESIERMEL